MNLSYLMNLVPAHEPALRPLLRQIRLRLALPPHSLITKSFTATLRCPRWFVIIFEQHQVESWLNVLSVFFEGTNTLIVLDDCAASEDVKGRTSERRLFGAPHGHQRVGADPAAALKHCEAFPREGGHDRPLLHAVGKDHEGHL